MAELRTLAVSEARDRAAREAQARGEYRSRLRPLLEEPGGLTGLYEVVRDSFEDQVRSHFDGQLPSVAVFWDRVYSRILDDFKKYEADRTPGKRAKNHPISDLLRGFGVDVHDEDIREEYLRHAKSPSDSDTPDRMIEVLAYLFPGWAATLLLPGSARHVGDSTMAPMAYLYSEDGKFRKTRQADWVVRPAAELWPVKPSMVDPTLRNRVMAYVDDHDQLTGADYEWAEANAADPHKFANDVGPAIHRWVDLQLKLKASAGTPTPHLLMQILTQHHLLFQQIDPPFAAFDGRGRRVNVQAGAAGEVPGASAAAAPAAAGSSAAAGISPKDTNVTVFLADVSGAGQPRAGAAEPAAQAPVEAAASGAAAVILPDDVTNLRVHLAFTSDVDTTGAGTTADALPASGPATVAKPAITPAPATGGPSTAGLAEQAARAEHSVNPHLVADRAKLVGMLPGHGGGEVTEADWRRLAHVVRQDLAMPRLGRYGRALAGLVTGRPVLRADWEDRLNDLIVLARAMLDRAPNSLKEFENVRKVRDLVDQMVPGQAGRVSVEALDLVLAKLGTLYPVRSTAADRERFIEIAGQIKTRHLTWAKVKRRIPGVFLLERQRRLFDAAVRFERNGVVFVRDPSLPVNDADMMAAQDEAEQLSVDPSRELRVVFYVSSAGGHGSRPSSDRLDLSEEDLTSFLMLRQWGLSIRTDARDLTLSLRSKDHAPVEARLYAASERHPRRNEEFLWVARSALARYQGQDPPRSAPHLREVRLHGETLLWVRKGGSYVLVAAPADHALLVKENTVVLYRKGDSPPEVVALPIDPLGRWRVVPRRVDIDTALRFLGSLGDVGEAAILDMAAENPSLVEAVRIAKRRDRLTLRQCGTGCGAGGTACPAVTSGVSASCRRGRGGQPNVCAVGGAGTPRVRSSRIGAIRTALGLPHARWLSTAGGPSRSVCGARTIAIMCST